MRKLIYSINITMDGCVGHMDGVPPPPDDDLSDYFIRLFRESDLFVCGRITYQLMVPYWPDILKNPAGETKSDVEFAEAFVAAKKVVFSRTLKSLDDKNARISHANLKDEILKLKGEEGKDILVGGVDIPSQLIALGLVDEFLFVVQPIIAGGGRRLMEGIDLHEKSQLKLIETTTFKSGWVALRYGKQ